MSGPRFLLYSHDAVGLGHTRRTMNIANALQRTSPGSAVLVVSGSEALELFEAAPGVEVMRLPGIRKDESGEYVSRRLAVADRDIRRLRSSLLEAAFTAFRPDAVLVDKHPGGAGGELLAALRMHRTRGGRCALGLRDILDEPASVRAEWERNGTRLLISGYDEVFVYGQPDVLDHAAAYGLRGANCPPLRYCGYVLETSPTVAVLPRRHRAEGRLRVLATVGGGEDGTPLLGAFIDSVTGSGWDAHAVLGPMIPPAAAEALRRRAAPSGVTLHLRIPDLASRFNDFDAVVTMGGYNTLAEAVYRGTPTVCIPRVEPRSEQAIRASAFSQLGLLEVVHPSQLTPAALRKAIVRALGRDRGELRRRAHGALGFAGAMAAAAGLGELAVRRRDLVAVAGGGA